MIEATARTKPMTFVEELHEQRWDDHRYYHQSRINQSLHLFSASCFLATYVLLALNPIAAAYLGWVVAFWSRQIGHFFFEPTGFDEVNQATFEHKEQIKVGYNLQRKVAMFVAWLAVPAVLAVGPLLGLWPRYESCASLWSCLESSGWDWPPSACSRGPSGSALPAMCRPAWSGSPKSSPILLTT